MQSEELPLYNFKFNGGWDNAFSFNTRHNVEYLVRFKPNANYVPTTEFWRDDLYEIVIEVASAPDPVHIPADPYIFSTVVLIIADFFANHQRVVLYIYNECLRRF